MKHESIIHPTKKDVLIQLYDFGSRQVWFLREDGKPDQRPRLKLRLDRFDDENDDGIRQLESLSLNDRPATLAGRCQTAIDEGDTLFGEPKKRSSDGKGCFEGLEQADADSPPTSASTLTSS